MAADRAHGGMKKEPHVARRERRDGGDFLVAQTTLKLEVDDFALIAGERFEDVEDSTKGPARVVLRVEVVDDRHLGVRQRRRPRRLLTRVERQVPADREQPRREMSVHSLRVLAAQPEEGLLHDVPCRVRVAKQPLRVPDQRPLVAVERVNHPLGVWYPAHSGPRLDNGGVANLLDRY